MCLNFDTLEEIEHLQEFLCKLTPGEILKINDIIKLMSSYIAEAPAHFYEHCREQLEENESSSVSGVELKKETVDAMIEMSRGMLKHTGKPQDFETVIEAMTAFAKAMEGSFYSFCIGRL